MKLQVPDTQLLTCRILICIRRVQSSAFKSPSCLCTSSLEFYHQAKDRLLTSSSFAGVLSGLQCQWHPPCNRGP